MTSNIHKLPSAGRDCRDMTLNVTGASVNTCKVLPFENRPSTFERMNKFISAATHYKNGPIFIKGSRIWVTCYGSCEGAGSREKEEAKLEMLLQRKFANYQISVRLEEE